MPTIEKIRNPRSKIGVSVRTMDRSEISAETIPALLAEKDIDVFWMDGSREKEGQAFAANRYRNMPGLCEVHRSVTNGVIGSFIYGVKTLIENGYEYLCFMDGDVFLEPNWLEKTMELYDRGHKEGLNVGFVSPRCFEDRILVPRDGYAVMGNLGAGMTMMARDVFLKLTEDESKCVLDNPSVKMSDIKRHFMEATGVEYPVNWRMKKDLLEKEVPKGAYIDWQQSCDWWWEVVLLKYGMVALAPTPSMAFNIDEEGRKDLPMKTETKADPLFNWESFCERLQLINNGPKEAKASLVA